MDYLNLLLWALAGSVSLNAMYIIRYIEDHPSDKKHLWRGVVFALFAGPLGLPIFFLIQYAEKKEREKQEEERRRRLLKPGCRGECAICQGRCQDETDIAGSRHLSPTMEFITGAIRLMQPHKHGIIKEVVSGRAEGVDREGEHWAGHMNVDVKPFPANWDDLDHPEAVVRYRRDGTPYNAAAGPIRNAQMADYADVLLLIWDGESSGSMNMRDEMIARGKPVYEVILRPHK